MESLEAAFEELVAHLSSLIDLHASDPQSDDLERLRSARAKAAQGLELLRQSRENQG